jgi:hypothetical protein
MKDVKALPGADISTLSQITVCKDLHYIEESHKLSEGKIKMGLGEVTYSKI